MLLQFMQGLSTSSKILQERYVVWFYIFSQRMFNPRIGSVTAKCPQSIIAYSRIWLLRDLWQKSCISVQKDDVRSLVLLLKGAETKQTVVMVFPFTVTMANLLQGIATTLHSERALKLSKSSLNLWNRLRQVAYKTWDWLIDGNHNVWAVCASLVFITISI